MYVLVTILDFLIFMPCDLALDIHGRIRLINYIRKNVNTSFSTPISLTHHHILETFF